MIWAPQCEHRPLRYCPVLLRLLRVRQPHGDPCEVRWCRRWIGVNYHFNWGTLAPVVAKY